MGRQKTIVVALGGNAILQPGQKGTAEEQLRNVDATAKQIAQLIASGYRVVITHGNGPQVGNLLIQHEAGSSQVPALPLDVCGAQSQGQIGYMMQQCLGKRLKEMGIEKPVVTVVTQMIVSKDDPAFAKPSKPVGPFYTEEQAKLRMEQKGEKWVEDAGRGWRKVVPSPDPISMVEKEAILALVESGVVVIANGGGGIPVVQKDGYYEGVEAVIDKDLGGQRLAMDVGADMFVILTDVDKVALNYKTPEQVNIDQMTLAEVEKYQKEGHFKAGSMGPKVEACRRFVAAGGEVAIIASLDTAIDAINGKAGTRIVK
ncbi:MAG: carbamate kinase [Bacillota bacterium]